jgi:UDP-N-acetylglucosamine:LPS N-acetylglucosamine transferase
LAEKPTILAVLTGGGFTYETVKVLQDLGANAEFVYLRTSSGGVPGEDGIPSAKAAYEVPKFATVTNPSKMISVLGFIRTFVISVRVLLGQRIDLVLAVGTSHAVPLFLAARLFGRKTVFLESITRADRLSVTGELIYKFRLATRFIVQWPKLIQTHPRSSLGTIL